MIQRVKNEIEITCDAVDFSTATDIEVYIQYKKTITTITPTVASAHKLDVVIPKTLAMKMDSGNTVGIQFACTISNDYKISDVVQVYVDQLLKEEGYGD